MSDPGPDSGRSRPAAPFDPFGSRPVVEHDGRLCGLAMNPALPSRAVDLLIEHGDTALLQDLSQRTDLDDAQVGRLIGRGEPDVFVALAHSGRVPVRSGSERHSAQVMLLLAKQDLVPQQDLIAYARHPDPRIRAALAAHPHLPDELIAELLNDPVIDVVAEMAGWAALPAWAARAMARHPDRQVRSQLAANPTSTVPGDVLAELVTTGGAPAITSCPACRLDTTGTADCGDHAPGIEVIRMAALQNPSTPVAALVPLVDQVEPWARATIASRSGLPVSILEHLADEIDASVRAAVAENPETPAHLLRHLASDTNSAVRRAVALNPKVPLDLLLELAAHTRLNLRAGIPRLQNATEKQLRGLAASRTAQVRGLAASHPDLPDDLRQRLTWDPDAGVAKNLADHPTLDADDLRLLAARHGPRLYSAIARNPNTPPELLHTMARNSAAVPKALREIARHPATEPRTLILCLTDPQARRDAAAHPTLPANQLTTLIDDPDTATATAAAANPSLPEPAMLQLIHRALRRH